MGIICNTAEVGTGAGFDSTFVEPTLSAGVDLAGGVLSKQSGFSCSSASAPASADGPTGDASSAGGSGLFTGAVHLFLCVQPFLEVPFDTLLPTDVSADARWVVVSEISSGGTGVVSLLPRSGNGEPIRYTPAFDATLSPNGQWLLFSSSFVRPEVFVQSVPRERGGRWQVSPAGGGNAVWRADGKEIFYLAADGRMMSVAVNSNESFFRPGTPKPLFQTRMAPSVLREYDVTRDGQKFLLNVPIEDAPTAPLTVVVNWMAGLKK